jgi:hypothetical protein
VLEGLRWEEFKQPIAVVGSWQEQAVEDPFFFDAYFMAADRPKSNARPLGQDRRGSDRSRGQRQSSARQFLSTFLELSERRR